MSARSRTPILLSSPFSSLSLSLFTLLFPSPPFPALFLFPSHAPLLCVKHRRLSSPSPLRPSASLQSSADSASASRPGDRETETRSSPELSRFLSCLIKTDPRVHRVSVSCFPKFQSQFSDSSREVKGDLEAKGGFREVGYRCWIHRHTHAKAVCTRVRHERIGGFDHSTCICASPV